jgi:hypothetical protein
MNQRIPQHIRPTLQDYLSLVNYRLPDLMKGLYVEGSIALGGFNEHFSDIDFVALLNRPPTHTEFAILRDIHVAVRKKYPRWKMSGSYLQVNDLSPGKDEVETSYCFEGKLRLQGHFYWNWVAGWILVNHGIAILGPEPQTLPVIVNWDRLMKRMRDNLNSYWTDWTRRPDVMAGMVFDLGIQWAVLGVLRQFYSFRENSITTKTKAGEYALTCVPSRWHQLIHEAIEIRAGKKTYQFRIVRTMEAVRFLKFIIQACNAGFA